MCKWERPPCKCSALGECQDRFTVMVLKCCALSVSVALLFAVCHTAQRMPAVIARRKPRAHERGVRYDRFVLLVVQPNRSRALCGLL